MSKILAFGGKICLGQYEASRVIYVDDVVPQEQRANFSYSHAPRDQGAPAVQTAQYQSRDRIEHTRARRERRIYAASPLQQLPVDVQAAIIRQLPIEQYTAGHEHVGISSPDYRNLVKVLFGKARAKQLRAVAKPVRPLYLRLVSTKIGSNISPSLVFGVRDQLRSPVAFLEILKTTRFCRRATISLTKTFLQCWPELCEKVVDEHIAGSLHDAVRNYAHNRQRLPALAREITRFFPALQAITEGDSRFTDLGRAIRIHRNGTLDRPILGALLETWPLLRSRGEREIVLKRLLAVVAGTNDENVVRETLNDVTRRYDRVHRVAVTSKNLLKLLRNDQYLEDATLTDQQHLALREAANGDLTVLRVYAQRTERIRDPHLRAQEHRTLREIAAGDSALAQILVKNCYNIEDGDFRTAELLALARTAAGPNKLALREELIRKLVAIDDLEQRYEQFMMITKLAADCPAQKAQLIRETRRLSPGNMQSALLHHMDHANDKLKVFNALATYNYRIPDASVRLQQFRRLREICRGVPAPLTALVRTIEQITDENERDREYLELVKAANGNAAVLRALRQRLGNIRSLAIRTAVEIKTR